jgi:hypothetical protein
VENDTNGESKQEVQCRNAGELHEQRGVFALLREAAIPLEDKSSDPEGSTLPGAPQRPVPPVISQSDIPVWFHWPVVRGDVDQRSLGLILGL